MVHIPRNIIIFQLPSAARCTGSCGDDYADRCSIGSAGGASGGCHRIDRQLQDQDWLLQEEKEEEERWQRHGILSQCKWLQLQSGSYQKARHHHRGTLTPKDMFKQ